MKTSQDQSAVPARRRANSTSSPPGLSSWVSRRLRQIETGLTVLGVIFVFFATWLALASMFSPVENPVARWLLSGFFVLYWPYVVCGSVLADSELKDRSELFFTGGVAFLAVSAGSLYDHVFPHFTQHRFLGTVPKHVGLEFMMAASLLFGYVMAMARVNWSRPKRQPQPEDGGFDT